VWHVDGIIKFIFMNNSHHENFISAVSKRTCVRKFIVSDKEEKYGLMDWIGSAIGILVAGFIIFILIWPLIDPTPNKSSSLKENIHKATEK